MIEFKVAREKNVKPNTRGNSRSNTSLEIYLSGGDTLRLENEALSLLGLPQHTPAEMRSRSQAQTTVVVFLDSIGRKITHRSSPDKSSLHIPAASKKDLQSVVRSLPRHWEERHPGEAFDPRRIKGLARAQELFTRS